ncbi:MAG: AsmA family protein [Kiritimatiellae bacterium]|nr:AsmA family protein [Kiritimatiellia bacterium]
MRGASARGIAIAASLLIALLIAGGIVAPRLARAGMEGALRAATGADVRVGRVSGGLWPLRVRLEEVRVENPDGFGPGEALEIRELLIVASWSALWRREPRLELVRLDVPRVVVVRRADGQMNWQRIGEMAASRASVPAERRRPPVEPVEPSAEPAGSGRRDSEGSSGAPPAPVSKAAPAMRIGQLNLKVGTVELREFSSKERAPRIRRLDVRVDHTLTNVCDLGAAGSELAGVIAVRAAPILIAEALTETATEAAGRAMEKLERGAMRLLQQLGGEVATNLPGVGGNGLRRALPGVF